MKKLFPIILFLVACISLGSCKKDSVKEQYTETIQPVIPDLTTQVYASVSGFVADEQNAAVEGAVVKAGALTTITDAYGYFNIKNAGFAKSAGFVQINKSGYYTGTRTFLPSTGKETFVRLQLIPKTITGSIGSATGGTVSTADGASVKLPADAVVVASGNTAYNGTIHVAAYWLNPANQSITQQTMPGDLRGIDSAGFLNALTTYGMLAVELTGDAGESLQIAAGKTASLSFPIPASLQSTAPASIPLWYFDEDNGLWKQQGSAVKTANNYQGDVSHFTYWNCDIPSLLVNFSIQIVDMSLRPLVYVPVSVSISGTPNSQRTGYTDTSGFVSGMIPANSDLVISASTPCNAAAFSQDIHTTNSNVNLGVIKIEVQNSEANFRGTVNKCNGAPVTDGYVIIASSLTNTVVNLQNGIFNSTTLVCPGGNASVIAFDRETTQQSTVQNITISTGTNDFGVISACNPTTVETIIYILDGVTKSFNYPYYSFGGDFFFATDSTNINAQDILNGGITVFAMGFNGAAAAGSYTPSGYLTLDQQYYFVLPATINITSYGLIGEFIVGSINCSVTDVATGAMHTFSCSFNVKRDS